MGSWPCILGLIVAFALILPAGWLLIIGMVLTWELIWLVHRAPDVPDAVRNFKLLPYAALAIAYIPNWFVLLWAA